MNIYQKIILGIGAIALIYFLAIAPVKYEHSTGRYIEAGKGAVYYPIYRVDIGATSLRGLAVVGATAAIWAIAGKTKKKSD